MGGWGLKDGHPFNQDFVGRSLWSCIKFIGLWIEIMTNKYIYLDSFVDWIKSRNKNVLNASIHWKALCFPFPLVGSRLAWKVGVVSVLELRWIVLLDVVTTIGQNENLIEFLQIIKKETLDKVSGLVNTTIWDQDWLDADVLNIPRVWKDEWKNYTIDFKRGHIRLIEEPDDLFQNYNEEGGNFTANLRCIPGLNQDPGVNLLWWKALWKVSTPLKAKILVWLVFNNNGLTWDKFQKMPFWGPSMCPLCKCGEETNGHLFNPYAYTKEVWGNLRVQYKLQNLWMQDSFINNLNKCFTNKTLKVWRSL